jgi:hypothetical protein
MEPAQVARHWLKCSYAVHDCIYFVLLLLGVGWISSRIINFSFPFFVLLGFELRALPLLVRGCTSWAMFPALFALVIFHTESHIYAQGWPGPPSSYLYTLNSWDDRCMLLCPVFFSWDGVSQTFCLGWPGTSILPISTFWISGITGKSHHTQLTSVFLELFFFSV